MSFSFPPEIEDEIFELVVRMRPYYHTDASLPLVSKRVQAHIERILYETVKLHGDYHSVFGYTASDENHFAVAVSSRAPSFFEMHVKNLCLTGTMTEEHASRVLSVCTGVRNLALWKRPSEISQVAKLRLRSLDTSLETVRDLAKLHHVFPELVSLSVTIRIDEGVMPALDWLPELTHVRLGVGRENSLVPTIIRVVARASRRLQSILIVIDKWKKRYASEDQVEAWGKVDPRILIQEDSSSNDPCGDWEDRIVCNTI